MALHFRHSTRTSDRSDHSADAPQDKLSSSMTTFDFLIDQITDDGLIYGMNGALDIPAGTVFRSARKSRISEQTPSADSVELGEVARMSLRLVEVHWYRKVIDFVPGGHSAGLRVEGSGIEAVRAALEGRLEGEYVHLLATSEA